MVFRRSKEQGQVCSAYSRRLAMFPLEEGFGEPWFPMCVHPTLFQNEPRLAVDRGLFSDGVGSGCPKNIGARRFLNPVQCQLSANEVPVKRAFTCFYGFECERMIFALSLLNRVI